MRWVLRRYSRGKGAGGFQGQGLAPPRLWKRGHTAWSSGDYISREHLRATEGRDLALAAAWKTPQSDWKSQRKLGTGRASPRGLSAGRVCGETGMRACVVPEGRARRLPWGRGRGSRVDAAFLPRPWSFGPPLLPGASAEAEPARRPGGGRLVAGATRARRDPMQ